MLQKKELYFPMYVTIFASPLYKILRVTRCNITIIMFRLLRNFISLGKVCPIPKAPPLPLVLIIKQRIRKAMFFFAQM